jgi:FixJ family two-component response regulator
MRGAADYIEKPDDERLVAILARRSSLARTANERALATENKRLRLFVPTLVAGLRDAAVLEPIDRAGGV